MRVLLMVSKFDHCLTDLLYRYHKGEMDMTITAIVSNHLDLRPMAEREGIRFIYLPVTKDTKARQEAELMKVVDDTGTELVVLARYMQILSDDLCRQLSGRAINIHHSFLPGFKGAKPYHQAYQRGVKLIGATAHYVTSDLDEGPIIEQEVQRVDHVYLPDDLVATGRDTETVALSKAVEVPPGASGFPQPGQNGDLPVNTPRLIDGSRRRPGADRGSRGRRAPARARHPAGPGGDPGRQRPGQPGVCAQQDSARAEEVGIRSPEHRLGTDTSTEQLLDLIARLNADGSIHGILLQLPLPAQVDELRALQAIDPGKDVDGFQRKRGGLSQGARARALHTQWLPVPAGADPRRSARQACSGDRPIEHRRQTHGGAIAQGRLLGDGLAFTQPRSAGALPSGGHRDCRLGRPRLIDASWLKPRCSGDRCRHQSYRRRRSQPPGRRCRLRQRPAPGRGDHPGTRWCRTDDHCLPDEEHRDRSPYATAQPIGGRMPFNLLKYGLSSEYPVEVDLPPPRELKSSYDVVIIGAGGHGLATAYYLARYHGITNIAVLEKSYLGGGNTARNTAVFAPTTSPAKACVSMPNRCGCSRACPTNSTSTSCTPNAAN